MRSTTDSKRRPFSPPLRYQVPPELSFDEMMEIDGGCWLCTVGATIAGAATGAGIVLALASNPAGWVVAGGAVIGGGLGYLVSS